MQPQTNNVKKEVLFVLCGSILFLLFAIVFLALRPQPVEEVVFIDDETSGMTNFELGQYYFNHDDSPEGPYDLQSAQYYYDLETSNNPAGNNLAWYQSGRIDFINGDFDKALEKFDKQLEYFGDTVPNAYYMIGLTYGYKAKQTQDPEDWKRSEDAFKKSVQIFYDAPWPKVDLAWVYFSQGKYEEMKPVLEEGLIEEANNPWLLNMYGLALLNTGKEEMAGEYFIFALEIAEKLTVEDWGRTYPGNNPDSWGQGLEEFKGVIAKNIEITKGS